MEYDNFPTVLIGPLDMTRLFRNPLGVMMRATVLAKIGSAFQPVADTVSLPKYEKQQMIVPKEIQPKTSAKPCEMRSYNTTATYPAPNSYRRPKSKKKICVGCDRENRMTRTKDIEDVAVIAAETLVGD
jgi:hypothetical protein